MGCGKHPFVHIHKVLIGTHAGGRLMSPCYSLMTIQPRSRPSIRVAMRWLYVVEPLTHSLFIQTASTDADYRWSPS